MTNIAIRTKTLSKSFGSVSAVSNLNLEIESGEIFGFLGPNGAGKSTTIRMFLNFIRPSFGEIEILGLNPNKHQQSLMNRIGYVSGDVFLYENYKVKDLLNYFEKLHGKKSTNRDELIERFNLDESKKISTLSKGNKQKVALIQAFMNDPKLLILDEPTSGLDPLLQIEFNNILKEFKQKGVTTFLSSHVLDEVQKTCDRIGIIKDGKLVSVDSISNLMDKNIFNIELEFKDSNIQIDLATLNNAKKIDNRYTFTYEGDVNLLINELNKFDLKYLNISDPNLEELFLHYY